VSEVGVAGGGLLPAVFAAATVGGDPGTSERGDSDMVNRLEGGARDVRLI
jgi:hypothetical protein